MRLALDGQAFLPHAREPPSGRPPPYDRALRVDVPNPRIAPAVALHGFHGAHPGIELDVVTLPDADAARAGLPRPAPHPPAGPGAALPRMRSATRPPRSRGAAPPPGHDASRRAAGRLPG
ncbi:hypothetical protein E1286_41040 [Nonomuraea terrae]|uniref:Uncharacterized protein n=1 Tax=Nonomuraea terrae TaxID=2530383 RepID=A0A4V2YID1_9ACTN|nr:hypothetical protein [Nonomuraea terrae]TDD34347.1 hypothetical protein E1286_41040 [Nonomuraea terrae]